VKKTSLIIVIIILILIAVGIYFWIQSNKNTNPQQALQTYNIQGMKVEILQQGNGAGAKIGDRVTVNYVGTLQNGTKFDSSIDRGQPFPFTLGQNSVIKGWELGVVGMNVGEKRRLTIPPELAYGSQGSGATIPPNATLIFEIDLLGINQ
jgi:FKBP-type peptidyl-prolyl cis-trans isomerase FkpA